MKVRIKVKKLENKPVVEQNNINTITEAAETVSQAGNPFEGLEVEMAKLLKSEIEKDNLLLTFSIPGELYSDIPFPSVNSNFRTLMRDLGDSAKRVNVRNMMPDPTATIADTKDMAKKYFSGVKFQLGTKLTKTSEFDKKANTTGKKTTLTITKESVFDDYDVIDDALFESPSDHSIGNLFGLLNHDNDLKNSEETTNAESKDSGVKNVDSAIDMYIESLLKNTVSLLRLSAGKGNTTIGELDKLIRDLVNHGPEQINEYLKANDKVISEARERKKDLEIAALSIGKSITDRQKLLLSALAGNNKIDNSKKIEIAKQINGAKTLIQLDSVNDKYHISESITNYNGYNILNEDETEQAATDNDNIEAKIGGNTIEEYYKEVKNSISSKIGQILAGSDPEESRDYVDAKNQMEDMKKFATDTVMKRIDIICKTGANAGGEQQGISSKISAFLSKHPLRAEKLKALWKGHEVDLNKRMNEKLKKISQNDGALGFCTDIMEQTIPQLFARLLTYKAIILFLQKKEIYKKPQGDVKISKQSLDDAIEGRMTLIHSNIELALNLYGHYLTEDDGPIMNGASIKPLPYLGIVLYNIVNKSTDKKVKDPLYLKDAIERCKTGLTDMESLIKNISLFIINDANNTDILSDPGSDKYMKVFDEFNIGDLRQQVANVYDTLNKFGKNTNGTKLKADQIRWSLACLYSYKDKNIVNIFANNKNEFINAANKPVSDSVVYNYVNSLNEAAEGDFNIKDIKATDSAIAKAAEVNVSQLFKQTAGEDRMGKILNLMNSIDINSICLLEASTDIITKLKNLVNILDLIASNILVTGQTDKDLYTAELKTIINAYQGYVENDQKYGIGTLVQVVKDPDILIDVEDLGKLDANDEEAEKVRTHITEYIKSNMDHSKELGAEADIDDGYKLDLVKLLNQYVVSKPASLGQFLNINPDELVLKSDINKDGGEKMIEYIKHILTVVINAAVENVDIEDEEKVADPKGLVDFIKTYKDFISDGSSMSIKSYAGRIGLKLEDGKSKLLDPTDYTEGLSNVDDQTISESIKKCIKTVINGGINEIDNINKPFKNSDQIDLSNIKQVLETVFGDQTSYNTIDALLNGDKISEDDIKTTLADDIKKLVDDYLKRYLQNCIIYGIIEKGKVNNDDLKKLLDPTKYKEFISLYIDTINFKNKVLPKINTISNSSTNTSVDVEKTFNKMAEGIIKIGQMKFGSSTFGNFAIPVGSQNNSYDSFFNHSREEGFSEVFNSIINYIDKEDGPLKQFLSVYP